MAATDILGKIGEKLGAEHKQLTTDLQATYATKVSLGNLKDGTDSFSELRADSAEIGNLTVTGTTTTLNTTTVSVEDNIIEVNLAPETGNATATTGGLEVNRGNDGTGNPLDKASAIFDDADDKWKLLLGTAAADLVVSSLEGNVTGSVTGDLIGDVKNTDGTVVLDSGDNSNAASFTGNLVGNISSASGDVEVSPSSSILVVKGNGSDTSGQIKVNCHANTHGQTIMSQPHSEGVTNVLLLPGGSDSTLVSEVASQTLTNKSLTSPTITGTGTAAFSTISGALTGSVAAAASTDITINNVALGDYATFETAYNTAKA